MSAEIAITRAGPLASIQDAGRFGALRYGVSASGPMDRRAFAAAGMALDRCGAAGIEITPAGLDFTLESGALAFGCAGGAFTLAINGASAAWPGVYTLQAGESVSIRPGGAGNYGYLRFDRELQLDAVLGSVATNLTVGLGGLEGRALRAGDRLAFGEQALPGDEPGKAADPEDGPIRVLWGLHAERFDARTREKFLAAPFTVSRHLDRMGVRLEDREGVFSKISILSLVSDAIVPGDIQILGDGTPIVLMRDHQPTGGYPRIATIADADLDRFAQLRPGTEVRFVSIGLEKAHGLMEQRR